MLEFKLNAVIRGESPALEDFADLVNEIESAGLFQVEPRRLRTDKVQIGRFHLDRDRYFFGSGVVYTIYESQNPIVEGHANLYNRLTGYELHTSHGRITRVNRIDLPAFAGEGIILLRGFKHRYM